jgi:thiol-disulfide isomerase/thioredoxin
MTPTPRWRRWLFDAVLVLGCLLAFRAYQQRGVATDRLPESFDGTTLDGEPIAALLRAPGPTLVHVWAAWCGVCSAMAGSVHSVAQDHTVISVASRSGPAGALREHSASAGAMDHVLVDEHGTLARALGVSAYPTTFFVDADGRIRFTEVGYTTELGLRLRLWWLRHIS